MVGVVFVCLGNICRSPLAEAVFRALVRREGLDGRIRVDSAGTADDHVGEPPDARAVAGAQRRGIELTDRRARQIAVEDFRAFDYALAMDRANRAALARLKPADAKARLGLLLDFAPDAGRREVPDPYDGGAEEFDLVLDLVEAASQGLLAHLRRRHL